MREQVPCLVFQDRLGNDLLTVGLRPDGSPVIQGRWQEMPLAEVGGNDASGARGQAADGRARPNGLLPAAPTGRRKEP